MKLIYNKKKNKYNIYLKLSEYKKNINKLKYEFKGINNFKFNILILLSNINIKHNNLQKTHYKSLMLQLLRLNYLLKNYKLNSKNKYNLK